MKKALIFGIDDYPSTSLTSPLLGCVYDAKKIGEILSSNYDGSLNFHCKVLVSSELKITQGIFREELEKLLNDPCDIALLYFSGISTSNKFGNFLATQDYSDYDCGVSFNEIMALANQSTAKNIIIILDCCHSERFGDFISVNENYTILRKGISILGGTQASQHAMENSDRGIFTSLLYDALEGKAADYNGDVNLLNMYSYAHNLLSPWKQSPVLKTHLSSLVNLRKAAPKFNNKHIKTTNEFDKELDNLINSLNEDKIDKKKLKVEIESLLRETTEKDNRKKVFISYSHIDRKWLNRIQVHLKPVIRERLIDVWDDTRIESGQNWKEEIDNALKSSAIAVLLVSADFLASDFIIENELPPLLKSAKDNGTVILPVILSHCRFTNDKDLSKFQAVNNPNEPLESLTKSEQDRIFLKVSLDIEKVLNKT